VLEGDVVMFKSFFLAGFDAQPAASGVREQQIDDEYRRLREVGIRGVREAVRWPVVDRKGHYDFSPLVPFLDAARTHGIDVIWDLFRDGYPDDLDPFQPAFIHRFASYCAATARFVQARSEGTCWFTPIDQPSWFAWAGAEVGRCAPHRTGDGRDLKVILARATIAGINAIRSVCPGARIVNVDPLCHVVPPMGTFDRYEECEAFNHGAVFEAWDLLSGRLMPELGGTREHLDVIGITYSWAGQWEIGSPERPLAIDDSRRVPLRQLVRRAWERYGGEVVITGISHLDDLEPASLAGVERECSAILAEGIPLRGVCLSPSLGWPGEHVLARAGAPALTEVIESADPRCRTLCQPMLDALRSAQRIERRLQMGARI